MKKSTMFFSFMLLLSGSMAAQNETGPITEAKGESAFYSLNIEGYGMDMYENKMENIFGELVRTGDGTVYYSNFVPAMPTYTYVKGQENDGKITFSLPQTILSSEGGDIKAYLFKMKSEGEAEILADATSVDFIVTGNNLYIDLPEGAFLGLAKDDQWLGYGITSMAGPVMSGVQLVSVPEDAKFEQFQFVYSDDGKMADVAFVGNDVYLKNFITGKPNATIKGTIQGDKVTFESDQFVGGDTNLGWNIFMIGARGEKEEGDIYPYWYKEEQMSFNYDAETKTLKANPLTAFLGNIGQRKDVYYYYLYIYQDPIIKPWSTDIAPAAPKNPEFVGLMPYDPTYLFGQIYYNLPAIDINDNVLDKSRLFYNFLVDDEVYPIMPDEYPGIEEEMTDIPWSYSDAMYDIYGSEVYRYFTYRVDGFDYMGIQSFYVTEEGKRLYSDIMVVYADGSSDTIPAGVKKIEESGAEVAKTEYYDLQGRQLRNPENGVLVIKKTTLTNGKTLHEKMILR